MNELKRFAWQMARVWAAVTFVVGTVAFIGVPVELGPMKVAERPAATHLT